MAPEQRPYYLSFTARLLQASFNFMFLSLGLNTKESKFMFTLEGAIF